MVRHNRQPFAFGSIYLSLVMCFPHFSLSLSPTFILWLTRLLCAILMCSLLGRCRRCRLRRRRRRFSAIQLGRCYRNHGVFCVCSVKKTFKGLRTTSWHTTKETTERRRCGREKMYYFGGGYCCSIYFALLSAISSSLSRVLARHGCVPHKCTHFFFQSRWELANVTPPTIIILRLMCAFFRIEFLHNFSFAHIYWRILPSHGNFIESGFIIYFFSFFGFRARCFFFCRW